MGKLGNQGWGIALLVFGICQAAALADSLDVLQNQFIDSDNRFRHNLLEEEIQEEPLGLKTWEFAPKAEDLFRESAHYVYTDYRFTDTRSRTGAGTNFANGADIGFQFDFPKETKTWSVQGLFTFTDGKTGQTYGTTESNAVGGTARVNHTIFDNGNIKQNWTLSLSQAFAYAGSDTDRPGANGTTSSTSDSYKIAPSLSLTYAIQKGDHGVSKWTWTPTYTDMIQSTEGRGESNQGTLTNEIRFDRIFDGFPAFGFYAKAAWLVIVDNDPTSGTEAIYPNWARIGGGVSYHYSQKQPKGPLSEGSPPDKYPSFMLDYAYEAWNPTYESHSATLTVKYVF